MYTPAAPTTVGNSAACALYLRAGFVPYGVESRNIKLADVCRAIERMILHLGVALAPLGAPYISL